jgi:hypothetical protein
MSIVPRWTRSSAFYGNRCHKTLAEVVAFTINV